MSVALIFVLAGCGGLDATGPAGSDPTFDPDTPSLVIRTPEAGQQASASAVVSGDGNLLDSVTVNGATASLETDTAQHWSATVPLETGLNTFEVVATSGTTTLRDVRSVVYGDHREASGSLPEAVQIQVGAAVLEDLSPLITDVLDPVTLQAQLQALNPVVDTGDIQVSIDGLDFGAVDVVLLPGQGVLEVGLVVHDVDIDVGIDGLPFGIDEAEIEMDALIFDLGVQLSAEDGHLVATLIQPAVAFDDFDFELDTWLIDLFIGDGDVEDLLLEEIDALLPSLQPQIDQALAGLELSSATQLLGMDMEVDATFAYAAVTPAGIDLVLDVAADVNGNPVGGEHLVVGTEPMAAGDGIAVELSDDFVNRFLHEVWAGGGLDMALAVEPYDTIELLLTQVGGVQGAGGSFALAPRMAPVFVARGGESRLQLGEVLLTMGTPGGAYGDELQFNLALDARATFVLEGSGAGIQLSDARVKMVPLGAAAEHPELLAKMEQVQTTLGLGLGALGDLLSFELAPGTELPALDVDRADKGTRIGLGADAILALLAPPAPLP